MLLTPVDVAFLRSFKLDLSHFFYGVNLAIVVVVAVVVDVHWVTHYKTVAVYEGSLLSTIIAVDEVVSILSRHQQLLINSLEEKSLYYRHRSQQQQ